MIAYRQYRKPHRYKKKKPLLRLKFLVLGFLVVLIIGAAFYGLFLWNLFWVEKVVVSGEREVSKQDIESLVIGQLENTALFFKTKSIFTVDAGQIKEDILKTFPQVASAEVKKSFFDTVGVEITERAPVAVWCENERCFYVDEGGVVFKEADSESGLIIIETNQALREPLLGSSILPADKISQILTVKLKLFETLQLVAVTAKVSDERLDVEITEGWTIRFNLKGDLSWQVTELKLALEKQISPEKRRVLEYVDLRFSRIYYK